MAKYPPDLTFIPAPSTSKQSVQKKVSEEPHHFKQDKKGDKNQKVIAGVKNRLKEAKLITEKHANIDTVLEEVKTIEEICAAIKCKVKVRDFSIKCDFCKDRFCTTHYLPEVHGCGEAARKDAQKKYLHPQEKLPNKKKSQCETKLHQKLREMQNSRKKTNTVNTKKSEAKRK